MNNCNKTVEGLKSNWYEHSRNDDTVPNISLGQTLSTSHASRQSFSTTTHHIPWRSHSLEFYSQHNVCRIHTSIYEEVVTVLSDIRRPDCLPEVDCAQQRYVGSVDFCPWIRMSLSIAEQQVHEARGNREHIPIHSIFATNPFLQP